MVFNLLQCVLLLKLLLTARAALGPHSDLRIVNADVKPDGFTRPAVLADGSFPGPLIRGNKGDNFQINVIDKLTNEDMLKSTSIHWHGLFQRGTNWADGPAFVTQCPITTGHAFMYNFDVPDQAGTFWYHSHLSTQYCDGLRGPLVVYDANDPHRHMYDVDTEDTVITLADWYHTLARKEPSGPVTPDSTLINGLGRYSNQTEPSELSVITVQWNKRYRMRLINMACEPNYQFSIDNHNMTVIEADGVNTQPLNVTSLTIFAGQRYSFILHANQLNGTYWIRAKPSTGADPSFNGGLNSAILRYNNVPLLEPTTTIGSDPKPLNEMNLHPLVPTRVPGRPHRGGADFVRDLKFTFNNGSFFVNNVTFVPPTVPVLLQILSGARNAQDLLPKGSLIELPRHSSVELSMPGGVVGGGHPLHLHGHNFHVVRSAGSDTYNYENPVIRDTVNIGGKVGTETDNVTIRFETDNAGPWFLHCHIDWHLDAGFAVVMVEDIPHIKPDNIVSSDWDQLCPLYDSLSLGEQ